MCHNLGADTKADPFKFSKEIYGAKYQWGKSTPILSQKEDLENLSVIMDWDKSPAPDNSWSDDHKTANDPCPTGYRVPTELNWRAVIDNNPHTRIGTWENKPTNYSSGIFIYKDGVPTLMLPTAGFRWSHNGDIGYRGENASYWSSTLKHSKNPSRLLVKWDIHNTGTRPSTEGNSVRCMKEN